MILNLRMLPPILESFRSVEFIKLQVPTIAIGADWASSIMLREIKVP